MALFSTLRSVDHSARHDARAITGPTSLFTEQAPVPPGLPRHLLVALAGIIADVTALGRASEDDPATHAEFETILARLDGLVDSIYEAAVAPVATSSAVAPVQSVHTTNALGRRQSWVSASD